MSLDQNLFTLFFTPNTSFPAGSVVDLVDGSGTIHYRRRRIVSQEQQLYRIQVSDPLSEALLATASAPSPTSKHKTVELYNPSHVVELKYTGTLSFRWAFSWETHEFEWKREECFIIRKPDPPVLVAVTREPPGRIRTTSIQILDYNLNRFDIEDRKGLEIVILTALLTFHDASDVYHEPSPTTTTTPPTSTSTSTTAPPISRTRSAPGVPPPPPPKPAPRKGVERIAELQLGRGQVNEVTVLEEGAITDYAKHCVHLLHDDAMLFISVLSSDPNQVPKVLQVVEETKRLRYKAGEPDLHQYVAYDKQERTAPQKGPRIINLDDHDSGKSKNKEYTPPKSLTVHLSKIDMPELRPRGTRAGDGQHMRHDRDGGKKKKKKDKSKEDGRSRGSSPTQGQGSARPVVLHKHRSQNVLPTLSGIDSSSSSSSLLPYHHYHPPPPLPPRRHSAGTHFRQSVYDPAGHYGYGYSFGDGYDSPGMSSAASPSSTGTTSGILGRFLGR